MELEKFGDVSELIPGFKDDAEESEIQGRKMHFVCVTVKLIMFSLSHGD